MNLGSQEHEDLMAMFERENMGISLTREDKVQWPRGFIYCNGTANLSFLAYRRGYATDGGAEPIRAGLMMAG